MGCKGAGFRRRVALEPGRYRSLPGPLQQVGQGSSGADRPEGQFPFYLGAGVTSPSCRLSLTPPHSSLPCPFPTTSIIPKPNHFTALLPSPAQRSSANRHSMRPSLGRSLPLPPRPAHLPLTPTPPPTGPPQPNVSHVGGGTGDTITHSISSARRREHPRRCPDPGPRRPAV